MGCLAVTDGQVMRIGILHALRRFLAACPGARVIARSGWRPSHAHETCRVIARIPPGPAAPEDPSFYRDTAVVVGALQSQVVQRLAELDQSLAYAGATCRLTLQGDHGDLHAALVGSRAAPGPTCESLRVEAIVWQGLKRRGVRHRLSVNC